MRYMDVALVALLVALLGAPPSLADTVRLKNGDRLSGTLNAITDETVSLTTSFGAKLEIPRAQVKTLASDRAVSITPAQGPTRTAFVSPAPGGAGWIEAKAAATMPAAEAVPPAPPAALIAAPTTAPGKVYKLDLEPYGLPVGPHWKNSLALGVTNTTGNTESTEFSAQVNFHYDTKPHELTMKYGGAYGFTNHTNSAQLAYGDIIYRRSLPEFDPSGRWYLFAENHELYDGLKGISLRSTTALGPGYYLFKSPAFTLDFRAGPGFLYERFFSGHTLTQMVGLAGLRGVWNINERTSLSQDMLYTVSVQDAQNYQITSETALGVKLPEIQRGMGVKLSFRDDYDNATTAPRQHNDTRLVLSLTLDF